MFLYEQINEAKHYGQYKEFPTYIQENLNQKFELRPYQIDAFRNFITYFENDSLRRKPTQTLFHMATGSGKTLIMAGLMIYLYKKGYRNFLFFVNLANIVQKTKDNFLNAASSKYLFNDTLLIDGEHVQVKEVRNFQSFDPDAINICFTTTQGLHSDMWMIKENGISFEDFENINVVLISDEAHHLNASTKKMNKAEEESYHSWEDTVKNIFDCSKDNILLEFTATCDLGNQLIKASYENKIVFDYPLKKFRQDLYSKEIVTLRSDMDIMDRALQAIVLSQYRLKIFQKYRIGMKPIVLFKAAKVVDSKTFMTAFLEKISRLSGAELERISELIDNPTMNVAYAFFKNEGITFDMLAEELKSDFASEHCVSVNEETDLEEKQLLLNSLEDYDNPYRAIFEVRKLDEGWDVLNLFDIVRLYETRQSGGKSISAATVSEAQLIGRGARYCPFALDKSQPRYQRKFDNDLGNELRICEELYYHCQNDSRYIGELHNALKEIGIDADNVVTRKNVLKDSFVKTPLYKEGYVFINDRKPKSRINGVLPSIKGSLHYLSLATGLSGEDLVMEDESPREEKGSTYTTEITFKEVAGLNYAIINKALAKYPSYRFAALKGMYPNLTSMREFITSDDYFGGIRLIIKSKYSTLPVSVLNNAVNIVVKKYSDSISNIQETYEGTREFQAQYIRDIFTSKECNYTDPHDGGVGVSQSDASVPAKWRLDLSSEEWFAYEDNYGTSEEKAFVSYFKRHYEKLKAVYDSVYLVRNERQFHLYSFDGGERFEPDYVIFLRKKKAAGYEQIQVFAEPKGGQLIEKDAWKEEFLLQIEKEGKPVIKFVDDNSYKIWGIHFYNEELRLSDTDEEFKRMESGT